MRPLEHCKHQSQFKFEVKKLKSNPFLNVHYETNSKKPILSDAFVYAILKLKLNVYNEEGLEGRS